MDDSTCRGLGFSKRRGCYELQCRMHPQVHRPYYKLVRAGMSTMALGYFLQGDVVTIHVDSIKRIEKKKQVCKTYSFYEEPNKHKNHFEHFWFLIISWQTYHSVFKNRFT